MICRAGVNIIAPPMWMLLQEKNDRITNDGAWYQQTTDNNDGDKMNFLHVLVQDVDVIGVFSDWPATPIFYANCAAIK